MAGPQDANSGFLRNKSFVKPETKDFHSFYCYNCLILFACWVTESEVRHDRWKLSSAQPTPCHGICQGFAALDRCSFCHYVTINISMDDTDTEHTFHVDLRVADTFPWRGLQLQSQSISEENSSASDIASW